MRLFLLILSIILALACASAQSQARNSHELPAQPVVSGRFLPQQDIHLITNGAKSIFWGTFAPMGHATTLGVHFFQLKPRRLEGEQTHSYGLDLFSAPGAKRMKRIQSARFSCTSTFGLQGKVINVQLLWLDKAKHVPILKFSILSHGDYGLYGDELTLTFAQGWHHPPVVQTWSSGSWFSSDSIGQENDWKHRDSRGMLEVISVVNIPEPNNPQRVEWWRWQSGKFVQVKTQVLYSRINLSKVKAF